MELYWCSFCLSFKIGNRIEVLKSQIYSKPQDSLNHLSKMKNETKTSPNRKRGKERLVDNDVRHWHFNPKFLSLLVFVYYI